MPAGNPYGPPPGAPGILTWFVALALLVLPWLLFTFIALLA